MAMTFPTNPSVNDEYTNGDRTWYWDGDSWVSKSVPEVVTPANVSSLTNDSAYLSTVDFGSDIINKPTTLDGYGISNAGGKGLTQSGSQIIINGQEIPGSRDLDTYRTTGIFPQNANADAASGTNYPVASAGILQVINDDYGNGLFTTQLYDQYSSNNYWARSYYNGTWTAWRNLAQDNDNYVDSLSWNSGTGVITVGRTGSLADLTVDIDGRYQLAGSYVTTTSAQALADTALSVSNDTITLTKADGSSESVTISDANNYADSINFTTADGILTVGRNGSLTDLSVSLDGRYQLVGSYITSTHHQALAPTALGVNNDTITLYKADGSSESVSISDANTNYYLSGATFNSGNGIITFARAGLTDLTVDIDGRYQLAGSYQPAGSYVTTNSAQALRPTNAFQIDGSNNVTLTKADGTSETITLIDTNNYASSLTWDSSSGTLTVGREGLADLTTNMDGRYVPLTSPLLISNTALGLSGQTLTLYKANGTSESVTLPLTGVQTETDPVFSASPAGTITDTNKSQWNSAYSWGNHASVGYITSYTETDTLATVTSRGASTSIATTFNAGITGDLTGHASKFEDSASNRTGNIAFFVNDGGGNLGMRFNATGGATSTSVEPGSAWELQFNNDSTSGDFVIYSDVAISTAGETISFVERLRLEGTDGSLICAGDITAFSDERLKENIVTIPDALNTVSKLRGVNFTKDGHDSTGVIAQEVEEVMPQVVHVANNEDGIKSVAYGNMVGVLIEAIKELKAEVDELKSQLNK